MIHRTLEDRLAQTAATWKWQRAIKATAVAVSFAMLVALALGSLAVAGWISSPAVLLVGIGLALFAAAVAWIVMIVGTVERRLDRKWLAAEVERDQQPLMDRFNAVLELDGRPQDVSAAMYRDAIERQATTVIRKLPNRSPFSWLRTNLQIVTTLVLMLLTGWFYLHYQPLRVMAEETSSEEEAGETGDDPLAIPELPTDDPLVAAEQANDPWGEIRISQPGRDLRITPHEDIPLLIEAAADRALDDVFWSTVINDDDTTKHELPEFEDPRYAVFQPVLSPDDLGLREWDLVHYQAVAVAEDETEYQSATYFVEVIPSRDQLDEMPEAAYEQFERMTELIQQQQEVIRQTDRLSDAGDPQQARQMEALADQENRIANSAATFQAALESRLGPEATQSLAASIESARAALQDAESALGDHDLPAASDPEKTALMSLADARRDLAELVEQHPEAFAPSTLDAIEEMQVRDIPPADPEFAKLLEQLDHVARETADVAEQLDALAADQQQLTDEVRDQRPTGLTPWAQRQRDIEQRLETLQQMHPAPFRDLTALSAETGEAIQRAAERLEQSERSAADATEHARERLQQLADEMNRRRMAHELAQAETLDQRLEANRQAYREIEDEPAQTDPGELKKTTDETRQLLDELQQLAAEDSAQSDDAGQRDDEQAGNEESSNRPEASELARKLSPEMANKIASQCDNIGKASSAADRSKMAGELGKSLDQLSNALAKDMARQGANLDQQQIASQLEQMQNREQDLQSARQFVQQTLGRQRSIQRDAYSDRSKKQKYPSLAEKQLDLEQQLQQAMEKNPAAFDQTASQCKSARTAMRETAQSLSSSGNNAPQMADNAAQQLQQLDNALEKQQQHSGISDKQQVREMLEKLSQRLDQFAKQPDQVTPQQKQQTAGQCKSVGAKACQMAGQKPGGSGGGGSGQGGSSSPASSSTPNSDESQRQQQLNEASDQLASSEGDQQTSSAASNLQQQLESLASALGAPSPGGQAGARLGGQRPGQQPGGQQPGRQQAGRNQPGNQPGQSAASGRPGGRDALRPSGSEAIQRGLAQLETAARRGQQGRLTPEANRSLRSGGIADLVAGIDSRYGYNENSRMVVRQITEEIADPTSPVDLKTLQRLRQQIQSLQQDLAIDQEAPGETVPTRHVDPSRFPPDYRDSIQKYFETLSEQR